MNIKAAILIAMAVSLASAASAQINPDQINWPTGATGCFYQPGTNTCNTASGGGGGFNGINAQTTGYTALSGDNGKNIVFNCAAACSLTLPTTPPSSTWAIAVQNVGNFALVVTVPSGLTLDGVSGAAQLNSQMGILIWTDGTNYFTERGSIITRSNVTPATVQSKFVVDCASGGNPPCYAITLTASVAPGSALVVEAQHSSSSSTDTPTDVQGDTFTLYNYQQLTSNFDLRQWVACNAVGGPTTITVTLGYNILGAYEVSNVAASGCVDGNNSGQNTTNNATQSTGSVTTTQPYDFMFVSGAARTGAGGTTITEANSYTALLSTGLVDGALTYNSWYALKPATGSVSDTVSYSPTAGGEYAGILALKPSTSAAAIITGDLIMAGTNGQLQALHAGANGTVLTSNGPGVPPSYRASAPTSYPTPVTLVASNSAELDFTTCISSSYRDYELRFSDVTPASTTQNILVQLSTNGGSSYDTTSGHYVLGYAYVGVNASTSLAGAPSTGLTGFYMGGYASGTPGTVDGTLRLFNLPNSTSFKRSTALLMSDNGTTSSSTVDFVGTLYNQTAAVNAARVIASSGNIASGTVVCQPLPQ